MGSGVRCSSFRCITEVYLTRAYRNSIRFPNELRAEQTPRPPTLGNRVNNGNFDDGGWPGNRLQTDVFANQRIFTFRM